MYRILKGKNEAERQVNVLQYYFRWEEVIKMKLQLSEIILLQETLMWLENRLFKSD